MTWSELHGEKQASYSIFSAIIHCGCCLMVMNLMVNAITSSIGEEWLEGIQRKQ
jgi:hypothetical protein